MYHPAQQLRSYNSISSIGSHDEMEPSLLHTTQSSAPTSTQSSPCNDQKLAQQYRYQQYSPDLEASEFYSSEDPTHANHALNFRQTVVSAEAPEEAPASRTFAEPTGLISFTNSPSLSALASILEQKTARPSKLQASRQPLTIAEDEPTQFTLNNDSVATFHTAHSTQSLPDDLIDLDDSQFPQHNYTIPQNQQQQQQQQQQYDDIFKTPEVKASTKFNNTNTNTNGNNYVYRSMLDTLEESSPVQQKQTSPNLQQQQQKPMVLPKKRAVEQKKQEHPPQPDPQRLQQQQKQKPQQRSTSLPLKTKEPKKRKGFSSLFKSIRSVSTNSTSNIPKTTKIPTRPPPAPPSRPQTTEIQNQNTKSNAETPSKKLNSSASYFTTFKKKSPETEIKADTSLPNIQISDEHTIHNFDDQASLSTIGTDEFNENFNRFSMISNGANSIVSNGEVIFPKSLNAQEVESIVSIERSRSLRSRHSAISPKLMSHAEQFQNTNHQENYNRFLGIDDNENEPDLFKLSTNNDYSTGKKHQEPSFIDSFFNDVNDQNEEPVPQLEHLSNSSQEVTAQVMEQEIEQEQDQDEDVSDFMEFADFIDFGGDLDLDLNFDLSEGHDETRSRDESNFPLDSNKLLSASSPLASPALSSPSMKSPSIRQSPRLTMDTFIANTQSASRPISMSFRGLKAPALDNNHPQSLSHSESYSSRETEHEEAYRNFEDQDDLISYISRNSIPQQVLGAKFSNFKQPQLDRKVSFSSKIILFEAFDQQEYDRRPDVATCNQLTPALAQQIKNELNALKSEMPIHEDSRCYTHFY